VQSAAKRPPFFDIDIWPDVNPAAVPDEEQAESDSQNKLDKWVQLIRAGHLV